MEHNSAIQLAYVLIYLFSSLFCLWGACFAFYGLRRERGRPLAVLAALSFCWCLSGALIALRLPWPLLSWGSSALFRLSYSLILPALYLVARGDGFRGLKSCRSVLLLSPPLALNLLFLILPGLLGGDFPSLHVFFLCEGVYLAFIAALSALTLFRRLREIEERERSSVALILFLAVALSLLYGLLRILLGDDALFNLSAPALAMALVVVAVGYHRLDPFSAAAGNEERLRRFELMADASRDLISVVNRDFRYEAVNAAFCNFMQRSREDIVGHTVREVWGEESTTWLLPSIRECLMGCALILKPPSLRGGGSDSFHEVSFYPHTPQGASRPSHAVIYIKDITAYRAKEAELEREQLRAEEASRAKSDFLASMSHEIRTPINAILGLTELTLKRDLDCQVRDDLETVKAVSSSLLAIVNDILDLSRIEARQVKLERRIFSPLEVATRISKAFKPTVAQKGISLELEADPRLPPAVLGDSLRFGQIIYNLVGNAVKFTERGGITVSLSAARQSVQADRLTLVLEVRDTGIGIAEDKLETIFESFSQADAGTARRYGGTGLGLTISRQLSVLLGGDIRVESVPGSGSSFTATLCFENAPQDVPLPQSADEPPVSPSLSPPAPVRHALKAGDTCLLVEDNEINARVLLRQLELVGLSGTWVRDGPAAFGTLLNGRFDVVFMDIQMPVMDGFEAARRIRGGEAGERSRTVLLIAMTAHASIEVREKCRVAGMDGCLPKPLSLPDLESLVGRPFHTEPRSAAEVPLQSPLDLPILDFEVTLERMGGDLALVKELAGIFTEEAPERVSEILRAKEENDFEALRAVSHKVKGSAASMGALRVSAFAAALEKAVVGRDAIAINLNFDLLFDAYIQTVDALSVVLDEGAALER